MPAYEILFYNGETDLPSYHLIGEVEGETAEQALALNLDHLIAETRQKLGLNESSTRNIRDALYVLRNDGLLSARE